MWNYKSNTLDTINKSGKYIYRIFITDGNIDESFFLEYVYAPDDIKIKQDVDNFLISKNEINLEHVELENI